MCEFIRQKVEKGVLNRGLKRGNVWERENRSECVMKGVKERDRVRVEVRE